MSREVRVLILRAAGTNCDLETQHAWERAGAAAWRVHVRELFERPGLLDEAAIVTIPGGFSYGDDVAAGRILAVQIRRHLLDALRRFVDRGGLVLGICNSFQVLVQTGLLPGLDGRRVCTLARNEPPGFRCRWVRLEATVGRCAFLEPGRCYELPIAHGEGRVVFADDAARQQAVARGCAALRYVPGFDPLPANPNGSELDLAGLCDPTGRVLGLMPHPERAVARTQHPFWTRTRDLDFADGLEIFRAAVRAAQASL